MAEHKLVPYWIEVREHGEPDVKWNQTNIHLNERAFPKNNLSDYFHEFLNDYKFDPDKEDSNVHTNEDKKKTFTVERYFERQGNTVEGVFKSGEWGTGADFWDTENHERIQDARKENHAEEIPFYFLFHIPDVDNHSALLILSKYKRKGIKTLFEELFMPKTDIGDALVDISPHYSSDIINEIEEADSIASVQFRGSEAIPAREKYAQRKDIEKTGEKISGRMDVGTEFKLTPKGNQDSFLGFAKRVAEKEVDSDFEYGRIDDFSKASITVVEGDSQLTFPLWKDEIATRLDLDPDEYDLDLDGGYPTPYSLGCVARELANDLMGEQNAPLSEESMLPQNAEVREESSKPNLTPQD